MIDHTMPHACCAACTRLEAVRRPAGRPSDETYDRAGLRPVRRGPVGSGLHEADAGVAANEAIKALRAALHGLTARQHLALVLYYGLYDTPNLSLRALAPLVGVTTAEGARQIILVALRRLRHRQDLLHHWDTGSLAPDDQPQWRSHVEL